MLRQAILLSLAICRPLTLPQRSMAVLTVVRSLPMRHQTIRPLAIVVRSYPTLRQISRLSTTVIHREIAA